MNIPPEFPAVLQDLLRAELEAGNEIVEIGHSFPAPPAGAYAKLKNQVTTRKRASGGGIDFYDRNSTLYSGEFADARRFYFVLEPPVPYQDQLERVPWNAPAPIDDVVQQFAKSMAMDYEKWHDGIGYDMDLYRGATSEQKERMEELVLQSSDRDWRYVEALSIIDTPRARAALREAAKSRDDKVRMAVIRYAPEMMPEEERIESLVQTLRSADLYGGLSQALDEVEDFHPPQIVEELLRGVLAREGDAAVHFAAMLMYIHREAKEPFDWELRPWFLKFNTEDERERKSLYEELCRRIGR